MALPHLHRLPLRFERDRLNAQGERHQGVYFTLIKAKLPQDLNFPRFAVLISKKISPLSTERNRLKRLTTQALQSFIPQISPADYLIIPKKDLLSASYYQVVSDLERLLDHHD